MLNRCRECEREIVDLRRAVYLYETPRGPVYVCGRRCLARYDAGGAAQPKPSPSGALFE